LVDSRKIKTGLGINDEYTFIQGLSKPYTLTVQATNIFGLNDSAEVRIGVVGEKLATTAPDGGVLSAAPAVRLIIDPPVVTVGKDQVITLTWVTTNADIVTIEPGVGQVSPCDPTVAPNCNQRQIQAPGTDTIYTIVGQNPAQTISETLKVFVVDVPAPVITEFKVSPAIIAGGIDRTISLSWSTSKADKVTLTPDIGIVEPTGIRVIDAPVADTTYTLTVENSQGTSTFQTVNVKVRESPPLKLPPLPSSLIIYQFATTR
jgi:hypothetical protein